MSADVPEEDITKSNTSAAQTQHEAERTKGQFESVGRNTSSEGQWQVRTLSVPAVLWGFLLDFVTQVSYSWCLIGQTITHLTNGPTENQLLAAGQISLNTVL